MERLLMWLDDCDDLLVVARVQPAVVVSTVLATGVLFALALAVVVHHA